MKQGELAGFLYDSHFKIAHKIIVPADAGKIVIGSGDNCHIKLPFCSENSPRPYSDKRARGLKVKKYSPWTIKFPAECIEITNHDGELKLKNSSNDDFYIYAGRMPLESGVQHTLIDKEWLRLSPHKLDFDDMASLRGDYTLIWKLGRQGIEDVMKEAREIRGPNQDVSSTVGAGI